MPLKPFILAGVVIGGLLCPTVGRAQAPVITWSTVINVLRTGVKPAALRAQLGGRCVSVEPSPAEYQDLVAQLSRDLAPAEQVSFVSELQCVSESPADTVEVDVSSSVEVRRRGSPLTIQSDDPSDPVAVNGAVIGRVPQTVDLTPGPMHRIRIGEGPEARDTVISVRPGWSVGLRKMRNVVDIPGPPVPPRSELERQLSYSGVLEEIPELPPTPAEPRRPSGGATFLLALAAGGGAFAGSSGPCQTMATAPSPDGGSFGGTYYAPGTLVSQVQTACSGAAAGGAFLGVAMLASAVKKAAYRSAMRNHETTLSELAQLSVRRNMMLRQREISLDSALAERKRLAFRREITVALAATQRPQDASPFEFAAEPALQGTNTRLRLRSSVAPSEVLWMSSDAVVADVSPTGVVRFLRPGTVVISGTHNGKSVQQEFTVVERLTRGATRVVPVIGSNEVIDLAFWGTPNQTLRVETFGGAPNEDADLYIFPPNANPDSGGEACAGTSATSNERCSITIPSNGAGLWRIRILTFDGEVRGLRVRIQ